MNNNMGETRRRLPDLSRKATIPPLIQALALATVLALTGCKSTDKPANAGFASVDLHGNTPGQIWNVAAEVFREHGYLVVRGGSDHCAFEQLGSKMDNFAYGNWLETKVWIRVKASLLPLGEAAFRLQCDVVVVRDRGGSTEEEVPAHGFRHGPYQKLLDEVAARLKPRAPGPASSVRPRSGLGHASISTCSSGRRANPMPS
jgi:hypothetical protein